MKSEEEIGGATGSGGPSLSYSGSKSNKYQELCIPPLLTIVQFVARNPGYSRIGIYRGLGFSTNNQRHRRITKKISDDLELLEIFGYLEKRYHRFFIAPRGEKVIA